MAKEPEQEGLRIDNMDALMEQLAQELSDLYKFRDYFFEDHPLEMAAEKTRLVEEKMNAVIQKFDDIDENEIPIANRAKYLYWKGRTYNINTKYDPRASQCLSKAVKLNPRLVDAWNELGECYWKNLNIKDAKSSFEGALKQERNRVALRCLSIILRQDASRANTNPGEHRQAIETSVELAKEAVSQDPSDGLSWSVLGNAHLCRYFLVQQDPATLKASMGAYKQAALDPVARGQSDLYFNNGVALKYDEQYSTALDSFSRACLLDPTWDVPREEMKRLHEYLRKVSELIRTRGKIKSKKLQQMVQSIDKKMLGQYSSPSHIHVSISDLAVGENAGKVVLGKVVGSVHSDNLVPFTFALVDGSMECVSVTVYNWADGKGVIIGDSVALPAPSLHLHDVLEYKFKSIRINNPTVLLVNGKKIGRNQFAGTRVTSTYEIH